MWVRCAFFCAVFGQAGTMRLLIGVDVSCWSKDHVCASLSRVDSAFVTLWSEGVLLWLFVKRARKNNGGAGGLKAWPYGWG